MAMPVGDGLEQPQDICVHPLDRGSLLVVDGTELRAVDVVSGALTTLETTGRKLFDPFAEAGPTSGSWTWTVWMRGRPWTC